MDPVGLDRLLARLPRNEDPNLLVGYETSDDAAVYRLTDEIALVTTADFITPPVDDGYLFGQIAAANAISDVYAMGGRPLTCLNLLAFPSRKLPQRTLQEIVAGALERITAAGAVLAGGHSIEDAEPKFGLAVTGIVDPRRYWTNSGARPGDELILTKPLGSGVLFNANLKKRVSPAALAACVESLITLNRAAAETMQRFEIHAVTDVTGFGLAGHGLEMGRGSNGCLEIEMAQLPVFDEAYEMYRRGVTTGVNAHNQRLVAAHLAFAGEMPEWRRQILFDPQTSGGLLAAVAPGQAAALLDALHQAGVAPARRIGRVGESREGRYLFIH